MAQDLGGFPYWQANFDAGGKLSDNSTVTELLDHVDEPPLTDLFAFSHGWNNDRDIARGLYERFFGQMREVLDARGGPVPGAAVGALGVIWPSMRWADETPPVAHAGGAAGVASAASVSSEAALVSQLKSVFSDPKQTTALDEMADLLQRKPSDHEALARFHSLLADLVEADGATGHAEDDGEAALIKDRPEDAFGRMGTTVPQRRAQGGAGLTDVFHQLWAGAKEALRQTTYWQMKNRAGVVGQKGLGPLLGRLVKTRSLRIHLVGHSFGCRLVSFSLTGLPDGTSVSSIMLIQGAFSHFSFADRLPQDPQRSGALAGMQARVAGPLVVTHTLKDLAVGVMYPLASLGARQDAAGADDLLFRWGAMGHDGAQGVSAASSPMGAVGHGYAFAPGLFLNLDANKIIVTGSPPSGAHSDIIHPEIAWAALSSAGVV